MKEELKFNQSDFEWSEGMDKGVVSNENEEHDEIKEDFWFSSEDEPQEEVGNRRKSRKIILDIESIISQILQDLTEERLPAMKLPSKNSEKLLKFNIKSGSQFAMTLKLLSIIHHAVTKKQILTKRDIFYMDTSTFKTQLNVNRLVEQLSRKFQVAPVELGIISSPKGLMIGPLKIEMPDQSIMDFTNVTSVPSIPTLMCATRIVTHAKILIILEKEAMFQRLIQEFPNLTKEIIFLTAKGYPDLASRYTIEKLVEFYPKLTIKVFVDCDPYGLDIYRIYKQDIEQHQQAAIMIWKGLRPHHLLRLPEVLKDCNAMSSRDRRRAYFLLQKTESQSLDLHWRKELQLLLFLGKKAEMEALGSETYLEWIQD